MSSVFPTVQAIFIAAAMSLSARAVAPDVSIRNYQDIPDRNVFGLRPPPQVALSNAPVPLPKITLTGITTILGNKRALMKIAPAGMKPGDPAKEQSMILTEGQREGEIEVLQIDEKQGSVKVNNSGTVMLLTFEKDGSKLPATTAPGPGPGAAPSALPATAGMRRNPNALPSMPPVPGRSPRLRNGTTAVTGTTTPPNGGVPTPTGFTPPPAPAAPVAAEQDLTPEEQAIVAELQRQANASIPTFSPPQPTSETPVNTQTPPTPPGTTLSLPPGTQPPVLVPQ